MFIFISMLFIILIDCETVFGAFIGRKRLYELKLANGNVQHDD